MKIWQISEWIMGCFALAHSAQFGEISSHGDTIIKWGAVSHCSGWAKARRRRLREVSLRTSSVGLSILGRSVSLYRVKI